MGAGRRLKAILRDRKMTIKQLSEKAQISINTLYSITKRDSERVDPVILQRIADTLGISISDLTGNSISEAIDIAIRATHPNMTGKTVTFQSFTETDNQLIQLGGFSAISEFYNLSEEDQKRALEDIRGFAEYVIEKYKKQATEDKKTPPQPE